MAMTGKDFRASVALVLASLLACPPARALVSLNDGRDRIFVTGGMSVSQDSNIFANTSNSSDLVSTTSLAAEYTRRAGWIGVNGNLSISSAQFAKFSEENFTNPALGLELTKQTGRTTGSLKLNGARESRADAAVNLRTESWNYGANLNFRYPIVSTLTLSGSFGYASRNYVDETAFASLATYTSSLDLFHILSAERELIGGYRYRYSETSRKTTSSDHGFSLGLSGKLIRGVTGSLRVGYQTRIPHGGTNHDKFSSWTASTSAGYAFSKKLSFSGQLAKDVSTTATDSSVDTLSASVNAEYTLTSKWGVNASAGWGRSVFLGEAGRVVVSPGPPPVFGRNREDSYVNWDAGMNYTLNEHLKLGASYTWFHNLSAAAVADFVRTAWSLNVSSRW
jgi:hypothetical protein